MRRKILALSVLLAAVSLVAWRDPPFETPSPGPSPLATPTPSPGPTPNMTYEYVIVPKVTTAPAPGDPVIMRVELNRVRSPAHDDIQMQVLTSTDVVRVWNYETGRSGRLRQAAPGIFVGQGTIPSLPFLPKGTQVELHFTASSNTGRTIAFTVSVTF